MAAPPAPSRPGWYRDPDDPVQLRHWNGRAWESRHRTVPAWAVGVGDFVPVEMTRRAGDPRLDGPVHPAALPAIATALAPSSRPARGAGAPARPVGPRGATGAGATAPDWLSRARPIRRSSWSNSRLAFMVGSALVGLVVVVLAATVGLASRPATVPTLAQDSGFIRSANIACGEAMGAIRLTPPAPTSPAAVAAANRDLSRLAARIGALPVVDAARPLIQGWMDAWTRYAADRQAHADAAARAPGSPAAASLASTLSLDEVEADAFVTTNGLSNCTLTSTAPLSAH